MGIRRYIKFAISMFFIDWGLGALQANAIISYWWFLIFNFPFGVPFVLIETHWAETNYQLFGQTIGEIGSMVAWLFAVLGQALIYHSLYNYNLLRRKKHIPSAA